MECHGIEHFDAYQEKVLDETGFTYMYGAFHLAPFGEKDYFKVQPREQIMQQSREDVTQREKELYTRTLGWQIY